MTTRQLNRACHAAAQMAGIDKRVSKRKQHCAPVPSAAIAREDNFLVAA
jgi:hypothetical protein